jgi:hypothetical protein
MKRRLIAFGSLAIGLASMVLGAVALLPGEETQAADHLDSPLASNSIRVDINDVYAFTSSGELVVAVSCNRFTGQPSTPLFANDGRYEVYVDNTGDFVADVTVSVTFSGSSPQQFDLAVNGTSAVTGDVSGFGAPIIASAGGIQVFCGPRDDPFFFDLAGFQQFVGAAGPTGYVPSGGGLRNGGTPVDFFAGGNVSAIVIQLPVAAVTGAATTVRAWSKTFKD